MGVLDSLGILRIPEITFGGTSGKLNLLIMSKSDESDPHENLEQPTRLSLSLVATFLLEKLPGTDGSRRL